MNIRVIAYVRKRGAIGVYFDREFILGEFAELPPREAVVNLWLASFGVEWELHHIVSFAAE